MEIDVQIVEGSLPPAMTWAPAGAGAVLVFEGNVRPTEDGQRLAALAYEQYEPMTRQTLLNLALQVAAAHTLIALRVEHSVGRVPVGACSFRLSLAAAHRKATLRACDVFIDEMKQSVPLWKLPVWAEG
jgi:molybdopterin synthase catalytic subunit